MSSGDLVKCSKCGAPIRFFLTTAGKMSPVDGEPVLRGVAARDGETITVLSWMPHWATCPHAEEFRKKKESAK